MFYAHFVLSKRGPLAKIWLAAHWEKKLTKAQVYETNIDSTVDAILEPKVRLALRTSGHLLLGVVRIYSRKAKYLLADCNEAFVKIKMAFRPGVVDLPDDPRDVAPSAITLQENFDDFNANFDDFEMDAMVTSKFTVNQSRPEEITIKEDIGNVNFITDDGFGDVGFDDREILRDASNIEDSLFTTPAPIGEGSALAAESGKDDDDTLIGGDAALMDNDGFGDEGLDADFMGGGLFEDVPVEPTAVPDVSSIAEPPDVDEQMADPVTPGAAPPDLPDDTAVPSVTMQQPSMSDTTLLTNDEEAFALEPLDTTSMVSGMTDRKPKRRRKLLVDELKGLDSQAMKEQLVQTNDIVTTLDLAPPTRKLMQWKETGAVEKLFSAPGRHGTNKRLNKLYSRNLSVVISSEEDERVRRENSLERERRAEEAPVGEDFEFAMPQVPDMPDVPEIPEMDPVDNTLVPDEPTDDNAQGIDDQQPRKKRRTDKNSLEAEEVDSADEDMPPEPGSLVEQESAIAAEESTGDEVEDKRMNRRTHAMITSLAKSFDKEDTVSLLNMCKKNHTRKQAAAKFYTCLVLKKHKMIDVQQDSPFEDIVLSRGPNFARAG